MFTTIHSFPSMGVTIMCCPIQQLKAQGPFTGEAVPLLVRHLLLHRVHLDEAVHSLQALLWPSHRHLLVAAAKGKVALTLSFAGSWRGRAASVIFQSHICIICI